MASIGEVFLKLGFKVEDSDLKKMTDDVEYLKNSMLKLSGSAAAAIYGLMRFAAGTTESATALENLRDLTGENTQEVLKWMTAANAANTSITFDAVRESIQSVNQALSDAALGANRNIYMLLGVDWQKDGQIKKGTDFLNEIRQNWDDIVKRYKPFGGIPKLMADLSNLGVSRGMQQALMLSDMEFKSLSQNYQMAQKTIERNKELGQSIVLLKQKFYELKDNIVTSLAPTPEYFDNFVKGIKKIKYAIYGLVGIGAIFATIFSPLTQIAILVGLIVNGIKLIGETNFSKPFTDLANFLKEKAKTEIPWQYDKNIKAPWDPRYQEYSKNIDEKMKQINQTNNTTFNIFGAEDPQAVGDYVQSQLDMEKRNTWVQLNNGAMR